MLEALSVEVSLHDVAWVITMGISAKSEKKPWVKSQRKGKSSAERTLTLPSYLRDLRQLLLGST